MIRDRVDAESLGRLRLDYRGARPRVKVLDDGTHPAHAVIGLVHVACQAHPEPLVIPRGWPGPEVQAAALSMLPWSRRIALVVHGQLSERHLAFVHEEDVIDKHRSSSCAG